MTPLVQRDPAPADKLCKRLCCSLLALGAVALMGAAPALAAGMRAAVLRHSPSQPAPTPYLGVEFHDLTDAEATALHEKGTRGVLIVAVDHDGPAGKAGLRPQDVIVSVNGQAAPTSTLLKRTIHDAGTGVSLALTLVRQGQNMNVRAVLVDRGDVERAAKARMAAAPAGPATASAADPVDAEEGRNGYAEPAAPSPARGALLRGQAFLGSVLHVSPSTGLDVEEISPQLAVYFGAPDHKGLLVQSVDANTPGAEAGLRAGDLLLKADGIALTSTAVWNKHLRMARGKAVTLTVLREKQEQQVTLLLETKKHSMLEWPRPFKAEE